MCGCRGTIAGGVAAQGKVTLRMSPFPGPNRGRTGLGGEPPP